MNGPFVVAQANIGGASATPVQVLKLIKPKAGETDIMHASFTGTVKIDFTAIANEKITLFHDSKNQSLHVIFADGSQIIIEPFFNSRGTIMGNLILEMGPNLFYSGEQFAQTYTISEDPSVLPAAGAGGTAAGADFHDPRLIFSACPNPLGLLGPEELPGLDFTVTEAPILLAEGISPVVSGHLQFIIEEEELHVVREQNPEFNTAAGNGNEDTNDVEGDNLSAPPAMTRTSTAILRSRRNSSAATSPAWFPAVVPSRSSSTMARTAHRSSPRTVCRSPRSATRSSGSCMVRTIFGV